jgi:hypothetical protein
MAVKGIVGKKSAGDARPRPLRALAQSPPARSSPV